MENPGGGEGKGMSKRRLNGRETEGGREGGGGERGGWGRGIADCCLDRTGVSARVLQREIYFKTLAPVVVGLANLKSAGQVCQATDRSCCCSLERGFLPQENWVLALTAFN